MGGGRSEKPRASHVSPCLNDKKQITAALGTRPPWSQNQNGWCCQLRVEWGVTWVAPRVLNPGLLFFTLIRYQIQLATAGSSGLIVN